VGSNIISSSVPAPSWNPGDPAASLQELYTYSESQAQRAIGWYYSRKARKAAFSSWSRLLTIVLTALGGLIPILSALLYRDSTSQLARLSLNQWGYLAVGLAGLSLALDRFYGASSGWMRYITTASVLETLVEEFRFDWIKLQAALGVAPTAMDNVVACLDRLRTFSLAIRAQVEKETQAWVTEFQNTLSQLEQETQKGLEAAREQVRKDVEARQAEVRAVTEASRPGAVQLTVAAPVLDDGYTVELDGRAWRAGMTGTTCGLTGVAPGLHEISVIGTVGGKRLQASKVVTIVGAAALDVSIELS